MTADSAGPKPVSGAGTQTFGMLTIEKRVLLTPSRTVAIRNISNVSVGTNVEPKSSANMLGAIICSVIAIGAAVQGNSSTGPSPEAIAVAFVFGVGALFLFVKAFEPADRTHFLIISTNDGTRSLFTGPDRNTLDEVRRILSDKINADDEASTFNINFEKGTIESLNVAGSASVITGDVFNSTSTLVQGSNNQVAANSPGARVATSESQFTANNSPGAQVGTGNIAQGTKIAVQHVDYARFLPQIEEWQRFYSQHQQTLHLAERLSELEVLMRSGTPTAEAKGRVRTLAGDLGTILQSYPPAVQLFQDVLRFVGT